LLSTGNIRLIQSQDLRNEIFADQRQLRTPAQFELASLEYRNTVRGIMNPNLKLEIRECQLNRECSLFISENEALLIFEDILSETYIERSLSLVIEQWARGEPYLLRVTEANENLEAEIQAAER
jgi:hypothetical protein